MENQEEPPEKSPFKPEKVLSRAERFLSQPITPPAPLPSQTGLNLAMFTLTELMQLREDIHARLPPRKLAELDLEQELVLQFQQSKFLLNSVIADPNTPANQKAQTSNSTASILEQLAKLQDRLYNSERVKALETALVRAIRDLPEAEQLIFFSTYEKLYAEARSGQ